MKKKPLKSYYKKTDYNSEDFRKLSVSELKKIADYWLRQYLLQTTPNNNGFYICPIKNRKYSSSDMEVAHFIDRSVMNTRYDLENCHLISRQSNSFDAQIPKEGYKSLHHYDYEMYLGEKKVRNLLEKKDIICIFARQDYIDKINFFKNV